MDQYICKLALRVHRVEIKQEYRNDPVDTILEKINLEICEIDKLLEQINYMFYSFNIKQEELDKFTEDMIEQCKLYFEREHYGFDSFSKLTTLKIKLEQKKDALCSKMKYIEVLFDKNTRVMTDELIKLEDIYLNTEDKFNDRFL